MTGQTSASERMSEPSGESAGVPTPRTPSVNNHNNAVNGAGGFPSPSQPAPGSAGQVPSVLVVEDDEMSRHAMVRLLQMLGYRAEQADDGRRALEMARASHPRLVLMDLSMPGMDGLEAIRLFRDDPSLQEVPIVALTGNVSPAAREAVAKTGAAGFLEKPVDLTELETFLGRFIPKA
jgi:CheY-like chemotaxis protein